MPPPTWSKVTATNAAAVGKLAALGDPAKALLRDGLQPRAYFDLLMQKELFLDAIKFLAATLPKPEALWWACLCARQVQANPPPKVAAALQAAEKWVRQPSEENRRAAQPAAEAAELSTPAGCAAMGVFMSGGSIAPVSSKVEVPPAEHLTGHFVGGASLMAAILTEPEKAADKHKRFLALGQEVAAGTKRWT
jgi:hypothetical protein